MQIDDRLATVLRMQAASERAAQTQFRQLLDLAGSAQDSDEGMLEAAYERLSALSAALPAEIRAAIVGEPGVRLRNPGFVAYLASQELPVAMAAASSARLTEHQWEALIPALPVEVRSFLGQRRDLPESTQALLARIGIVGIGLPAGGKTVIEQSPAEPLDENVLDLDPELEVAPAEETNGIGALVRRIEAFRRAREHAAPRAANDAPHLPLGLPAAEHAPEVAGFDFTTDPEGRIDWAEHIVAPMVAGIALAARDAHAPAQSDSATIAAMRRRQPVRNGRLMLDGAPAVAGEWRIDATPVFTVPDGRFTGYRGRLRRPFTAPVPVAVPSEPIDSPADRMRQVIHELRTPVNAIQGFAEIIQQQLFGPTPNEYRALAAGIAGDAARMLAGFEELDRLVKLESRALELDPGTSDLVQIITGTTRQLDSVLRPRSAGIELVAMAQACNVALAHNEAEVLTWRILATLAGAASPGEALQIVLAVNGERAGIEIDLPVSLADRADIFESGNASAPQAVSAGMFGAGFTLRLARAEARAAGGELTRIDDLLVLTLPLANGMDTGGNIADTA